MDNLSTIGILVSIIIGIVGYIEARIRSIRSELHDNDLRILNKLEEIDNRNRQTSLQSAGHASDIVHLKEGIARIENKLDKIFASAFSSNLTVRKLIEDSNNNKS